MFIICTNSFGCEKMYLGWQNPAWDEDGYFWTSRECIQELVSKCRNVAPHRFLFRTEEDARRFARNELADVSTKWTIEKFE